MFKESMISLKNYYTNTPLDYLMRHQFTQCKDEIKKEIVSLFRYNLEEKYIKEYLGGRSID